MRDVGEGAAVHERRRAFQRLHEVRLEGVLQQRGHGALRLEVAGRDGLVVARVAHDDAGQALFEVGDGGGQAEDGHDLAGNRDVEAVLARHAVGLAAHAVHHVAQLAVVHVHAALPGDLLHVNAQGIALLNVVVQHRGQQIIGCANGVEVPGEVEVDVLHRNDLSIAAAGRAALHAKYRAQRGLAQANDRLLAQAAQGVRQADGGGGFALAGRSGTDGSYQYQLGFERQILHGMDIYFGLVMAVVLQIFRGNSQLSGHLFDRQHSGFLSDLDVGLKTHNDASSKIYYPKNKPEVGAEK